MLATLKEQFVFDIPTGQNRIFSLVRSPMLGSNTFADGGQGPEKPIIEEVDIEEEIFTFPYPEEKGEISDIVNPPVEGIVGEILHTYGKVTNNSLSTRDFSNIFSYLSFGSSVERSVRITKPEFVSLTRQLEIAGSYASLLVYSSYAASNANFNYAPNKVYESPSFTERTMSYGLDKPLYETKVPIPMISERIYYQAKENDRLYINPLIQPKSQPYQNVTYEEINVQPVNTQVIDLIYNNNISDSNFRSNLKLDYEVPKLELPLVRTKLAVLDINIKSNENKAVILPLYEPSYNTMDLAVPITLPEFHAMDSVYEHNIVNSDMKSDLKPVYEAPKLGLPLVKNELFVLGLNIETNENGILYKSERDVVTLPVNLGFDDTLLRDRFIAKLKSEVREVDYQDVKLDNEVRMPDIKLHTSEYTTIRIVDGVQVRSDLKYKQDDITKRQNESELKQYLVTREVIPKPDYKIIQSDFTLDKAQPQQIVCNSERSENKTVILPLHSYNSRDLIIPINQPEVSDSNFEFSLIRSWIVDNNRVLARGNVNYEYSQKEKTNVMYNGMSSDFALEFLDNLSISYGKVRVDLDPYALFNLRNSETQINYHGNLEVRNVLLPRTEYRTNTKGGLDTLVRVNYDNGKAQFLSGTTVTSDNYNLHLVDAWLQVDMETALMNNLDYGSSSIEQNLEDVIEQEIELTEGQNNENVRAEVYDDNIAQEELYEKSELEKEQETETNESSDSSVGYLAAAAGAVGVGLLAALMAPFSLILNKESYESEKPDDLSSSRAEQESASETYLSGRTGETNTDPKGLEVGSDYNMSTSATLTPSRSPEDHNGGADDNLESKLKEKNDMINPSEPEDKLYGPKQKKSSKKCKDTSNCFADTIDWLEGKLKNPTISDEEYESFSQCYSEEIKNIQKAREYIKKRENGYSCGGALYSLFHHIGFTEEQEKKYKLRNYIRNGEVQEGFKLATTIIAEEELEGRYDIEAIWIDDKNGGQSEKVALKKSSAYTQLDIGFRKQGYTPVWRIMSYIDTDTGEKRSGLYLETIAELHLKAKELLGDKDEYGMKLMGIILLINGQEPGQGTISMHDYDIMPGDRIDVLFKNDSARSNNNRQSTLDERIKVGSIDYSETEKSSEKMLEPILV